MTRTPTHCPDCGYSGGFDGLGGFSRKAIERRLGDDGAVEKWERWTRIYCPECTNQFALHERTVQFEVDDDGDERADTRELVADGGTITVGAAGVEPDALEDYHDLTETEQAILRVLADAGGSLPASRAAARAARHTEYSEAACRSAANRLTPRLIESTVIPTSPRNRRWTLTTRGVRVATAGGHTP